jgi:hypothetical protein
VARATAGTKSGKPIEMCFQDHCTADVNALVHGYRLNGASEREGRELPANSYQFIRRCGVGRFSRPTTG